MKEKLAAIREVMESIEVHGRDNIRRMLACINTLDDAIKMEEANEQGGESA